MIGANQELMPEGMISAVQYRGMEATRLYADVVIVGTGAGGGMAFHELAEAGVDVLALETGSWLPTEVLSCREDEMLPEVFAEAGSRATMDMSIQLLMGRGVGGSTLHNTNLCKRIPRKILEEWADNDGGLGVLLGNRFEEDFAYVEELLNVHPVPDEKVNANNAILARGAKALGYRHGRLSHNRKDCQGSGFCELGCPNNGKQNTTKVLVPRGLKAGGRVMTDARVDRVLHKNGRATGVEGAILEPGSDREIGKFVVEARRVILSASAVGSSAIALRSGLPDPYSLCGTNLHLHPGGYVVGVFDSAVHEPIKGWIGVPQSSECTEFLEFGHDAQHRAWLVSGFAHPAGAAGLIPGFGTPHGDLMKLFPRIAVAISMLHDYSAGVVSPGRGEQAHVKYRLNREDREQMALGLREGGRIMLAAGANRVFIPMSPPFFASSERDLRRLTADMIGPGSPSMVSVHPMSTMWMGSQPSSSVVDVRGEHHQVRHLYVADGSLYPTSIGGPPQIGIYTLGRWVAREVYASL